ncbi:MAG: hypothetical protein ACLFMM_06740 [Methanohalobium sp.]|uniref:hypothetical protein n=1 Tax=Methanohalobium sp. TaxID=2837493 RepID=UPI00397E79CE
MKAVTPGWTKTASTTIMIPIPPSHCDHEHVKKKREFISAGATLRPVVVIADRYTFKKCIDKRHSR